MERSTPVNTPPSSPPAVFFKRWVALTIACVPGALAGATVFYLWIVQSPSIDGRDHSYEVAAILGYGAMVWVLSLVFVPVFAVMGAPLLLMHRLIVGPHRPFFRGGYAAVALYGPLLLLIILPATRSNPQALLGPAFLYEVVALVATLAYLPLTNCLGVLADEHEASKASS